MNGVRDKQVSQLLIQLSTFRQIRERTMRAKVITGTSRLLCRLKGTRGQSLVEYALILSFLSMLSVVVLTVLGVQLRGILLPILNALAAARSAL
jgi:hypothetical protein